MAMENEAELSTGGSIGKTRQEKVYLTEPSDHPLGRGDVVNFKNVQKGKGAGKEEEEALEQRSTREGKSLIQQRGRDGKSRDQQTRGREETPPPRATQSSSIREGPPNSTVGGDSTVGGNSTVGGDLQHAWSTRHRSYRRVACLKGHSSRILHLDWTVDGRFVHTCGQDYQVLHWEILPPPPGHPGRPAEGGGEVAGHDGRGGGHDGSNSLGGELPGEEFRPRLFQRAFLLRDEHWATWSTSIGWPVQVWDA